MTDTKPDNRPDWITEDMLWFLDDLRESGVTNMFGARPYILEEYDKLNEDESGELLTYWMKSFSSRRQAIIAEREKGE